MRSREVGVAQYCESIASVTLHVATIYFNLAVKLHCYLTLCSSSSPAGRPASHACLNFCSRAPGANNARRIDSVCAPPARGTIARARARNRIGRTDRKWLVCGRADWAQRSHGALSAHLRSLASLGFKQCQIGSNVANSQLARSKGLGSARLTNRAPFRAQFHPKRRYKRPLVGSFEQAIKLFNCFALVPRQAANLLLVLAS